MNVGIRHRPPERTTRQRRNDGLRTRIVLRRAGGVTDENPAAGRRVACTSRIERTGDRHRVHGRLHPRVPIHVEEGLVWLPLRLHQSGRLPRESDAQDVRSSGDHNADLQMSIGELVRIVRAHPSPLRRDRELLHASPIQRELDLVCFRQTFHVLVAVALQPDLDVVLAVARKRIVDARAAAGAERQALEMLLLCEVDGNERNVRSGRANGTSNGEPTDLLRSTEVALEQRRRQPRDAHVVEAVARVVGWKKRTDVDDEPEQVTDGVLIFGLTEAPERIDPAGIGRRRGGLVERVLEMPNQRGVGAVIGARAARRRHHPRAKLPHDLLPDIRLRADARSIVRCQRETRRLRPIVVAAHAIAGDDGLLPPQRSATGGPRNQCWLGRGRKRPRHGNRALGTPLGEHCGRWRGGPLWAARVEGTSQGLRPRWFIREDGGEGPWLVNQYLFGALSAPCGGPRHDHATREREKRPAGHHALLNRVGRRAG